tara:strand:- start:134 stop:838 length:705 start_codon:yes stop_codon:yes gene_type:complete
MSKSIILSCGYSVKDLNNFLNKAGDLSSIYAFKINSFLALEYGLKNIVHLIKSYSNKPVIYDHQSLGINDFETSLNFSTTLKDAEIDYFVFCPFGGPSVFKKWVKISRSENLKMIVKGTMSHPHFFASNQGYFQDSAVLDVYNLAAIMGINNIIIPGSQPRQSKTIINSYKAMSESKLNVFIDDYNLSQIENLILNQNCNFYLFTDEKVLTHSRPDIEIAKWAYQHSSMFLKNK